MSQRPSAYVDAEAVEGRLRWVDNEVAQSEAESLGVLLDENGPRSQPGDALHHTWRQRPAPVLIGQHNSISPAFRLQREEQNRGCISTRHNDRPFFVSLAGKHNAALEQERVWCCVALNSSQINSRLFWGPCEHAWHKSPKIIPVRPSQPWDSYLNRTELSCVSCQVESVRL